MRPTMSFVLAVLVAVPTFSAGAAAEPGSAPRLVGMAMALADAKGASLVFGQNKGMKLSYRAAGQDLVFLGLDQEHSKLTRFADDKGGDLRSERDWLWDFPAISEDKHTLTFEVHSEKTPTAGAREIALVAEVALRLGSDPQVAEQTVAISETGVAVAIGPIPFQVKRVGKPASGKPGGSVELASETSLDELTAIDFLTADGRAIEGEITMSGGWSTNGKGSFTRTIELKDAAPPVKVRLRWFAKVESRAFPIDARIGVGF